MACLPLLVALHPLVPSADPAAFASFDPTSPQPFFDGAKFSASGVGSEGTERNETVPPTPRAQCTFPVYPSYDRTASVAVCQWRCRAPLQRVGEESPLSRLRSPSKIGRRYGDRKSHRRNVGRRRCRESQQRPVTVARPRRSDGRVLGRYRQSCDSRFFD